MLTNIKVIRKKQNEIETIDINTSLKDLYGFDCCYFEITENQQKKYINLKSLPDLKELDMSFTQWAIQNDIDTIHSFTDLKQINKKTLKAYSLNLNKFILKPTNIDTHIDDLLPLESCRDIALSFSENYHQYANDNLLLSVNGYLHRTEYREGHLYAIDGITTYLRKGHANILALDFEHLGGFDLFNITENDIVKQNEHSVYIKLPEPIGEYRTCAVSLFGSLHLLNSQSKTLLIVEEQLIKINIENLAEHVVKAIRNKIVKASDFNLTDDGSGNILTEELLSFEFIKKVINHSFTFGFYINRRNVYSRYYTLPALKNSLSFRIKNHVQNPIVDKNGLFLSNSIQKLSDGTELLTISAYESERIFTMGSSEWKKEKVVKPRLKPVDRYDDISAYELIIHGE